METMTTENRTTNRIPYEEDIRLIAPQEVKGRSVDIGAGGIGIIIPLELEPGTAVQLELFSGHAITLGTVRWIRAEEEGFRTGVQFRTEDWEIIELILSLRAQEG